MRPEDVHAIRRMVSTARDHFNLLPSCPRHKAVLLTGLRDGWVMLANAAMRARGLEVNVIDGGYEERDTMLMDECGPPFPVGPAVRYVMAVADYTFAHGRIPEVLSVDDLSWFRREATQFIPLLEGAVPGGTTGLPEAIENFDRELQRTFGGTCP